MRARSIQEWPCGEGANWRRRLGRGGAATASPWRRPRSCGDGEKWCATGGALVRLRSSREESERAFRKVDKGGALLRLWSPELPFVHSFSDPVNCNKIPVGAVLWNPRGLRHSNGICLDNTIPSGFFLKQILIIKFS